MQVLEVLVIRRPAGAGNGRQLADGQLAEGMRPKKLQRGIKDRLPSSFGFTQRWTIPGIVAASDLREFVSDITSHSNDDMTVMQWASNGSCDWDSVADEGRRLVMA